MALRVVFIQQDAPDVASLQREVDRLKLLVEANPIGDLMALMELFLAFLGFVLVIAGLVGFNEWNRVRKLSKQAEGILQQAEAQVARAAIASDKVHEMKEGLAGAWGHIDEHLSALTLDEQDLVVGISPSLLEPMSRSRFEDADILLVVSDRYNLLMDAERASGHFRALARFWRRVENHPRSLERLERASVLWPQSDKILIDLAMGQALWAATGMHASTVRSRPRCGLTASRQPGSHITPKPGSLIVSSDGTRRLANIERPADDATWKRAHRPSGRSGTSPTTLRVLSQRQREQMRRLRRFARSSTTTTTASQRRAMRISPLCGLTPVSGRWWRAADRPVCLARVRRRRRISSG
jgi:hypothetical protein